MEDIKALKRKPSVKVATRSKSKKQNPEEEGVFENSAVGFSKRYFLKLVFLDIEVLKWFLLVQDMYMKLKNNACEKGKCFTSYTI